MNKFSEILNGITTIFSNVLPIRRNSFKHKNSNLLRKQFLYNVRKDNSPSQKFFKKIKTNKFIFIQFFIHPVHIDASFFLNPSLDITFSLQYFRAMTGPGFVFHMSSAPESIVCKRES